MAIPVAAALVGLTTAHMMRQGDNEETIGMFKLSVVIPVLIVVAATILSLEILDHSLLSRPLSGVGIALVWGALLSEEQQIDSLVATIIYHGFGEAYGRLLGGEPGIFQSQTALKVTFWSLFWVRVAVWGATMATTNVLVKTNPDCTLCVPGALKAANAGLFCALHCECAELLMRLYFTTTSPFKYNLRQRALFLGTSFCIGLLYATSILALCVSWIQLRVSSMQLVMVLVVLTWISVRTPWPNRFSEQTRTITRSIASTIHKKQDTTSDLQPKVHERRRSSVLYRSTSNVEVVEMTAEFHPYDLRNVSNHHHHYEE